MTVTDMTVTDMTVTDLQNRLNKYVYNDSPFYQLGAKILYFNTFIIILYTFRAQLCSSSGGQIVLVQHLV